MNDSIIDKLQEPFKESEIEWRVGSTTKDKTKGLALAYVTNRAIQNRLDDVFGIFGWKNEFLIWKNTSQICGISVWDSQKNQWVTKYDGSDDSQTEATKGGLSDAMKRCAYQWGIGRYLYKLPQTWVPLKNEKYLSEIPKLPSWALPKNEPNKNNLPTSQEKVEDLIKFALEHKLSTRRLKATVLKDYKKVEIAELTIEEYEALRLKISKI
jgi:hypothetical protein